MKTKYRLIEVVKVDVDPDELPCWSVRNRYHRHELGKISWDRSWKQFVFCPNRDAMLIFSSDCLEDIAHFINQLKEEK